MNQQKARATHPDQCSKVAELGFGHLEACLAHIQQVSHVAEALRSVALVGYLNVILRQDRLILNANYTRSGGNLNHP